jgi:phenylpropionate dioxygenase-like ring-hydroxylating dioxygenase large terminal subunit
MPVCSEPPPLASVFDGIRAAAALPLERAVALPAAAYTSPEFFAWECGNLLAADWICLGHASQIPQPGDFLNTDLLGEPLSVVRGKDGRVRCLSRVCPHRAMDIMPPGFGHEGHGPGVARDGSPGCGHTRLFLCPYHSWTFDLDGRLKACPEMQQAEGFARDEWGLKGFPCEEWMGFLFVNLDGTAAEPPSQRFASMEPDLADWRPQEMEVVIALEWDCAFNWKVLVENFMESYHHLGAHAKTLQPVLPARDTWTEQERPHHVRAHLPLRASAVEALRDQGPSEGFPVLPSLPPDKAAEWALFLGYPNFLAFGGPDRLIWYRLDPTGPQTSRLLTTVMVPSSYRALPDAAERIAAAEVALRTFHLEDMEMCIAVQRGMNARGWQRGRLSHLEMPIWLFQRYLAARLDGAWPAANGNGAPSQRAGS